MSIFFQRPERITEAEAWPTAGVNQVDPDDHLYRALGTHPRDLTGDTLRRAQNLAVHFYRSNPLANRTISIYRSYIAGSGFAIEARNPELDVVLQDFWHSPRSNLAGSAKGFARDYLLFGEMILPQAADSAGNTTIGYIDPTRVGGITVNPDNNLLLDKVHLRREYAANPDEVLDIMRIDTQPTSPTAGRWVGDTLCWLHDRIAASTRGTPFLMPILDWLDAYDQVLWELLERQKAMRAHFWDVEVDGGQAEVDKAQAAWGNTAPRSGSVRFRTAAMRVNAITPDLGAQDDIAAGRHYIRHIATGGGLAPHWLGDPEDANRSTAESMDVPVLRTLADLQDEWRGHVMQLLQVAVDNKIAAGMLPPILEEHDEAGDPTGNLQPAGDLYRVVLPEITSANTEAAAASLASVATAFGQLDMLGAVGKETMIAVVRQLLPGLGIPADELPDDTDLAVDALTQLARSAQAADEDDDAPAFLAR